MRDPVLIGAEDVKRAASVIDGAADRMQAAATLFNESLDRLDEIATRFEDAAKVYSDAVERLILDGPS